MLNNKKACEYNFFPNKILNSTSDENCYRYIELKYSNFSFYFHVHKGTKFICPMEICVICT